MEDQDFNTVRQIFERLLVERGYSDVSEINGDDVEDFCKILSKELNRFYANI